MRKVRITVMRRACSPDLIEKYENPIEHPCDIEEGQVFIANGWERPNGLCESAWETMSPFVMGLAHGAEDFYDGWMKNPLRLAWLDRVLVRVDEAAPIGSDINLVSVEVPEEF